MAELSKELYNKLLLADTCKEVEELLKAGGREDVPAQEVWEQVQQRRAQDGVELSLDELADVAGGSMAPDRDWMENGCAATVEDGSDCWGTDGGCNTCHFNYTNMPYMYCAKCGRYTARNLYTSDTPIWHSVNKCRYCGEYKCDAHGKVIG